MMIIIIGRQNVTRSNLYLFYYAPQNLMVGIVIYFSGKIINQYRMIEIGKFTQIHGRHFLVNISKVVLYKLNAWFGKLKS